MQWCKAGSGSSVDAGIVSVHKKSDYFHITQVRCPVKSGITYKRFIMTNREKNGRKRSMLFSGRKTA